MNINRNTDSEFFLDRKDVELFEADKRRYRNFKPAKGSWAAQIGPDPFAEPGTASVVPF